MSRMIYTMPFLQVHRKIKEKFKQNPFKLLLSMATAMILLFLISFIVKEFLSPILEIIYSDYQKDAEILFFRSMNLALTIFCSLVFILSVFMGMHEQKEFDKMMVNYQISQFKRNLVHFIFELGSNLILILLLLIVLVMPSIKTQDGVLALVLLMFLFQSLFVLTVLLCLDRFIRLLMPKILWQVTLITVQGIYYYQVYQNLDLWHLSNYFNFMIGDELRYHFVPFIVILLTLYILNFKSYKSGTIYRIIRFQKLNNHMVFKNFKELIRHKENSLNGYILIMSVLIIKILKPELVKDQTMMFALISLTGMQSVYSFAYFSESLPLYRFSYQSSYSVFFSYIISLMLGNFLQFFYLLLLVPTLLTQAGTMIIPLILVNSIFLFLGKCFPLQERYGFNTSFQLALIVLLIVPMVILLFQIRKWLNLSELGFSLVQVALALVIQFCLFRSVSSDLTL